MIFRLRCQARCLNSKSGIAWRELPSHAAQHRVRTIQALRIDGLGYDVINAKPTAISQALAAKSRRLASAEVSGPSCIAALRLDRLGIAIGLEKPQHAVDMREVCPMLVKLAFQAGDDRRDAVALLAERGNDV